MTLTLADYEQELLTEFSPSWISFAKKHIFNHLVSCGVPTGRVSETDNLLFVGETSPYIQMAASHKKKFSILLFMNNPFHILSEMVLLNVDTLYVMNDEHSHIVRTFLEERLGGSREFKVIIWNHYPKMFEPQSRKRKLIGIMEPDFNVGNIFDNFYHTLSSILSNSLYSTTFDYAFYTVHNETYERLRAHSIKTLMYNLSGQDQSPLNDITTMPDALLSLDSFKYNPVLSMFARRIPVIRPDWLFEGTVERTARDLLGMPGPENAHKLLNIFVNQLEKVEELEKSKRIQDDLTRRAMLGDLYGDYSKFKRTE